MESSESRRQSDALPSIINYPEFERQAREGVRFQQRHPSIVHNGISAASPISPTTTFGMTGPPAMYSPSAQNGIHTPPDSRRTSDNNGNDVAPRQSLPSLHEALLFEKSNTFSTPSPMQTPPIGSGAFPGPPRNNSMPQSQPHEHGMSSHPQPPPPTHPPHPYASSSQAPPPPPPPPPAASNQTSEQPYSRHSSQSSGRTLPPNPYSQAQPPTGIPAMHPPEPYAPQPPQTPAHPQPHSQYPSSSSTQTSSPRYAPSTSQFPPHPNGQSLPPAAPPPGPPPSQYSAYPQHQPHPQHPPLPQHPQPQHPPHPPLPQHPSHPPHTPHPSHPPHPQQPPHAHPQQPPQHGATPSTPTQGPYPPHGPPQPHPYPYQTREAGYGHDAGPPAPGGPPKGMKRGSGYGIAIERALSISAIRRDMDSIKENASRIYHIVNNYQESSHPGGLPQALQEFSEAFQRSQSNSDALMNCTHVFRELSAKEYAEQNVPKSIQAGSEYGTDDGQYGDTRSDGSGQPEAKKIRRGRAAPPGRCHSCHRAETPEWRRGPDGARTLCNACGLHYAKLTRKLSKNAMGPSVLGRKANGTHQ